MSISPQPIYFNKNLNSPLRFLSERDVQKALSPQERTPLVVKKHKPCITRNSGVELSEDPQWLNVKVGSCFFLRF
jgi:hypothetical protein